ncbi:TniB family NTP-binding protein [Marinobacter sp. Arc7-DN-1]|uniref:TniB family NTP-binding protein n=1 Tax=Marinobacter sp. Arc7-DN-1 TaxID=2304594 RepID=UPI000E4415F6|nr:TniB family NTP-binding protein [Marinobacter sp. Arc7-DN-1]AXS81917.1 hypothetical protein D0851_01975 [Marinobacter sp. Arc7-DN-1]
MSRINEKREVFLDTIIEHPAFGQALDAIKRIHANRGPRAKGTIVYGDSGVGKTTLIDEYLLENPRVEERDRTRIPVVKIETHSGQTDKMIVQEVLHALNWPYPSTATMPKLFALMKRAFIELGVELVFFDEFQEVLPQKTKEFPQIVRFIKRAMNETGVPWILVGTDQVQSTLELGGNQMRRRFKGAYHLRAFSIRSPEDYSVFRDYIDLLQQALPFHCKHLTEENNLLRLYCATLGVPGFIANLLDELIDLHENDEVVTLDHLAQAHQRAFVGSGDTTAGAFLSQNPFLLPIAKVKEIAGRL